MSGKSHRNLMYVMRRTALKRTEELPESPRVPWTESKPVREVEGHCLKPFLDNRGLATNGALGIAPGFHAKLTPMNSGTKGAARM